MTKPHRQKYGLGSIIKKAARGLKKVAKSPIGKAALIGGGLWGLGRLGGIPGTGGIGKNWWSKGLGLIRGVPQGAPGTGSPGLWGKLKKFGLGKAAVIGGGVLGSTLPFLAGDEEDEVIDDWSVTPSSIANLRNQARDYYKSAPDYVNSPFMVPKEYVMSGYYGSKDGGIVGLANGGQPAQAQAEQMLKMEYQKYRNQGGTMSYQQFKMAVLQQAQGQGPMAQGQGPQMAAQGGRAGYQGGELVTDESMVEATPAGMMAENVEEVQGEPTREQLEALAMEIFQLRLEELDEEQLMVVYQAAMEQQPREEMMQEEIEFNPQMAQPQMAAEGGIMNLGGVEKDYRQEGGFVPLGKKEKADDVPARLSKNEFVFTADAVRNAGGGNIDKGAAVMQNMMKNLEAGGKISPESQGAQGMYNNMKQLQTRTA
jgi:hypothetical protein